MWAAIPEAQPSSRAVLNQTERGGKLSDVEVIWRQYPKVLGFGHYGHRLLFDDEGYLWISSGDRQKFTPAQDMQANLGKSPAIASRWFGSGRQSFRRLLRREPRWSTMMGSMGKSGRWPHRNVLGWQSILKVGCGNRNGAEGGDELNLVKRAAKLRLSDRLRRQSLRRA